MSIEARLSAGVRGIYPSTQLTATQRFVGNDAFRRSAGGREMSVYCSRRPTAQCPVLTINNCKY